MKIESTKNINSLKKQKVMIYGSSGIGKTKLIKTIKDTVLLLNADKGLQTLNGSDVDYITVSSWKEIIEFLNYIKTDECQKKYSWIAFDTVTAMFDILAADLDKKQKEDSKFDGFAYWKEYGARLAHFLTIMRDQETYNILCLFQHSTKEDKEGVFQQVFGLQGGQATKPPEFFNQVFALRIDKNGVRMLQTASSLGWIAKDRSQVLEKNEIADLNLIIEKIKGK